MASRNWDVLAIFGPSGSGKSTAADEIGKRFGIPWIQVDDLRLALQYSSVTLPEDTDALYAFERTTGVRDLPLQAQVELYVRVANVMRASVRVVIDSHLATNVPMVIEGDGIHPELVGDPLLAPYLANGRLTFVCLSVDSVEEIVRNSVARGRGIEVSIMEVDRKHFVGAHAYGQWLTAQSHRLGIPVVCSQPFESFVDRILTAIGP